MFSTQENVAKYALHQSPLLTNDNVTVVLDVLGALANTSGHQNLENLVKGVARAVRQDILSPNFEYTGNHAIGKCIHLSQHIKVYR